MAYYTSGGRSSPIISGVIAPTITGISRRLSDPLGKVGGSLNLIITGTDFMTGGTVDNVQAGGTNANATVDSDTQVTMEVPAHAAGAGNIVLFKGAVPSNSYTHKFWSPASETPRVFYNMNYTIVAGEGIWTPRYRNAAVEATIREIAAKPSVAAGGYPSFAAASFQRLAGVSGVGAPITAYTGFGDCFYFAAANITSLSAQGADIYNSPPLITDRAGYEGMHVCTIGGVPKVIFWRFDASGNIRKHIRTIAANGKQAFWGKIETGNLHIALDGVNWTTGDPVGLLNPGASGDTQLWTGTSFYSAGNSFNGIEYALVLDNKLWTPTAYEDLQIWRLSMNY